MRAEPASLEKEARQILRGAVGRETNWVAVTGAPSSGKTTALNVLASEGYVVAPDVARGYINHIKKLQNKTKWSIRQDEATFQEQVLWRMLIQTKQYSPQAEVLFDYALPDNIAFWKMSGLPATAELVRSSKIFRYCKVFIFEPLPFVDDEVRVENASYQQELTSELQSVYKALGYKPISVPPLPLPKRITFVQQRL